MYKYQEVVVVITYLIGNGFDINLGLHTSYQDFIPHYLEVHTDNARVKVFKETIRQDLEKEISLWRDAELAFGKKTEDFREEAGPGKQFNVCEDNFCNELAAYLKDEQERFKSEYYENDQRLLKNLANNLIDVAKGLKKQPQGEVESYISKLLDGIQLNFMVFNYTFTIDELLKRVKEYLGERYYNHSRYDNMVKNIIHPHGTVNSDMVFGVNDKSQITAPEIFDNDPIDLSAIIKEQTNEANEENLEEESIQVLESSDLIYIYGMSLGDTDKRWWERIIQLMLKKPEIKFIIAKHSLATNSVMNTEYLRRRQDIVNNFLSYSPDLTDEERNSITNRMFFDATNKFEKLKNIVPSQIKEAYMKEKK